MNTILIKRISSLIQSTKDIPEDIPLMEDSALFQKLAVTINDREYEKINSNSTSLSQSSEMFYRNNLEKNKDALVDFPIFHIEKINKGIHIPGLYLHKNGYLVFLLSTFNSHPLPKPIIDFYKFKIKILLDFCKLKQCYVYRCHYDIISRHDYLKLKRNNYCLWTYQNTENSEYYRITNFEHDIIDSEPGLQEKYFPETITVPSRKRRLSEDHSESQSKKHKNENINWREWVSASKLRNFMINDPLLDWLEEYNITSIYDRPDRIGGNSSNSRSMFKQDNEFIALIKDKGLQFENEIFAFWKKKYSNNIIQIAESFQARDSTKVEKTLQLMKEGIPILYQPVLHNKKNKTYGCPDFLIRNDWLNKIFNKTDILSEDEMKMKSKNLESDYYYVVVDAKWSTLHLNANGITLRNQGSIPAYKAQILIYNMALGELQGMTPNKAYILGKKWTYTTKGVTYSGNNCFDKLGIIDYEASDNVYYEKVEEGLNWIRDVRNQGHNWSLLPTPSRIELYPNMCNEMDGNWKRLKGELADKIDEITLVWMCGPKNRSSAFENDVHKWTENECTSEVLGFKGQKIPGILDQILEVNRSDTLTILPRKIKNNDKNWQTKPKLEFFIDFETLTSIFNAQKIGESQQTGHDTESFIFMIGLGHTDPVTDKWVYKDFTVNNIDPVEEVRILNDMWTYIHDLCQKHTPNSAMPNFYHWSHAEPTCYRKALLRANNKFPNLEFADLLKVFKAEPIVVKGSLNFGLKSVAKALYQNKMIDTIWNTENPCSNGLTAMVLAWKTYQKTKLADIHESPVIQDIIKYNEMDCKVLWEIIKYLRDNHT
ncbi:hypothetical protein CPAV1605_127 [seawater metagenome]|uniref:YprB ribonuclease H-like domain-containing protein n=1 Tax=seawater metagenome TaxID=1561972 RepID=A0A5E8CKU0_9ZZZZ